MKPLGRFKLACLTRLVRSRSATSATVLRIVYMTFALPVWHFLDPSPRSVPRSVPCISEIDFKSMTIDDPFIVTSNAVENSWHSEDGESWRTSSRTIGLRRSFSALALQRGARTNVFICAFPEQGFVPSAPFPTRTIAPTAPVPLRFVVHPCLVLLLLRSVTVHIRMRIRLWRACVVDVVGRPRIV